VGAITVDEVSHVDANECVECGACVDECPNGAISLP
jgi:ferredoxin